MPVVPALTDYTDGNVLPAASLDSDFGTLRTYINNYLLFKDVAGTVSVGHTFTATQTFTPGSGYGIDITTGGARIQAGGLTATGNALITGEVRSLDSSVDTRIRSVNASSAGQVGTFSNHPFWIVTNNSQRWEFQAAGHIVPLADNVYDFGTSSGPLRPRDLHLSRNAAIGGTLNVSGVTTLSGGIGATTFSGLITGGAGLTVSSGATSLQATTATSLAVNGNSTLTGVLVVTSNAALGSATELGVAATDGFAYMPRISGAPIGTPTAYGTRCPYILDAANNRLYVYNSSSSAWKYAALT